jgi:hypothetical protein
VKENEKERETACYESYRQLETGFWIIPYHILPFLSQKLTWQMSANWPKVNIWSSEKFHNLGTGLYNCLRSMAFSKVSYLMLPSSHKSDLLLSTFTTWGFIPYQNS